MENSMEAPPKIKNRITIDSSNPTSGYISKGIKIRISKRYLHSHIYCNIIHNSQYIETTCVHQKMDKEYVVYTLKYIQ